MLSGGCMAVNGCMYCGVNFSTGVKRMQMRNDWACTCAAYSDIHVLSSAALYMASITALR